MNKLFRSVMFVAVVSLAVASAGAALARDHAAGQAQHARPATRPPGTLTTMAMPVASPPKEEVKTASGEQFFIISSIDKQNSQVLLKRPTEVTVLVRLAPSTKFFAENGKVTTLETFHAGDTVWAKLSGESPEPTLLQMREGRMTAADLHRYYLDYSIIK